MTDRSRAKQSVETPRILESSVVEILQSDVAARAFELYCEYGYEDGHDLDDWLRAESELIARRAEAAEITELTRGELG
jgi:hypothetical protein